LGERIRPGQPRIQSSYPRLRGRSGVENRGGQKKKSAATVGVGGKGGESTVEDEKGE